MVDCLLAAQTPITEPSELLEETLENMQTLDLLCKTFRARKISFIVSDSTLGKVTRKGDIELLDYFYKEHGPTILHGCNKYALQALKYGHAQFFQHLENLLVKQATFRDINTLHANFLYTLISRQVLGVVLSSRLLSFMSALKAERVLFAALEVENIQILNLLYEKGMPLIAEAFLHTKGNEEIWDWLMEKSCPISAVVAVRIQSMLLLELVYARDIPPH